MRKEKSYARMNQRTDVQPPGGMNAYSIRDINKGLVSLHFLLDIHLDGVFTSYEVFLTVR